MELTPQNSIESSDRRAWQNKPSETERSRPLLRVPSGQHEIVLNEMLSLEHARSPYRTVRNKKSADSLSQSVAPPAPRLVGIESNPGPPKMKLLKSPLLSDLVSGVMAVIESKGIPPTRLAPVQRKRKKARKAPTGSFLDVTRNMSLINLPAAYGVKRTPKTKLSHSTFCITGTSLGGSVVVNNSLPMFKSLPGTIIGTNKIIIDPRGSGNTYTNFPAFTTINGIVRNFIRYRFKKLHMTYVPTCQMGSTAGSINYGANNIIFGAISDVPNSASLPAPEYVSGIANSVSGPVWTPMTMDLMANGGISGDWKFSDYQTVATVADQRQESPGSLYFHFLGDAPNITVVLGFFEFDFILEFEGLANEPDLLADTPALPPTHNGEVVQPLLPGHRSYTVSLPEREYVQLSSYPKPSSSNSRTGN